MNDFNMNSDLELYKYPSNSIPRFHTSTVRCDLYLCLALWRRYGCRILRAGGGEGRELNTAPSYSKDNFSNVQGFSTFLGVRETESQFSMKSALN
jgi:hypothetical protein